MIHRHLTSSKRTPVERMPSAALVDLLDRGDFEAWRPIAAFIRARPLGPFAERVLRLVDAYPMYGTSPLWRTWIERCRIRAEACPAPEGPVNLATLRRRRGLTQTAVAPLVGMSQSDLSKLERRKDVRLSTLHAYAAGLGGRLDAVFVVGDSRVSLRIGDVVPARRDAQPRGRASTTRSRRDSR